jgi:hypothetical protein
MITPISSPDINKNYEIEFVFKHNNLFKSLAVVADPKTDSELATLADMLYEKHKKGIRELSVYFFRTNDAARKFTFLKLVKNESDLDAVSHSHCIGFIQKNSFSIIKDGIAIVKSC